MDIRWGFVFWKGELECERPQSTYIPETSVVPATQKPKGDRSCLSLGVLPWIPREEGPTDSTLTTMDFRAGRIEKHLKQAEDPLWLLDSPTDRLEKIVILRTLNTSKTCRGNTGVWVLRSAQPSAETLWKKTLRNRKKLSPFHPGKEGSQPTFRTCQKHQSSLFSF